MVTDVKSKTDLIEQALQELAHQNCPYCERFIGMSQHITREEIEEWVEDNI